MRDTLVFHVTHYRSMEQNEDSADFEWQGKEISLSDGNLFYMLHGNLIDEQLLEPEGKVLFFEMQDEPHQVNIFNTTERGESLRLSFRDAIRNYINNIDNWSVVTKEDMKYEKIVIDRIQCQGIHMYVKKRKDELEFSGNDLYHLRDLLDITPDGLNNALNHENLRYSIRRDELIDMLDIGRLVLTD